MAEESIDDLYARTASSKYEHTEPHAGSFFGKLKSIITSSERIGGDTKVYKGRCYKRNIDLAIKIMDKNAKNEREANFLPNLEHENIVKVLEVGDFPGIIPQIFIAMELCPWNLSVYIQNNKDLPFDFQKSFNFSRQLVTAVVYLHEKHIVHRDLKPWNILISRCREKIKVTDMGLSRTVDIGKTATTVTHILAGSTGFKAPETYQTNATYHYSSDIFPLGINIYFIFSGGKHPFGDDPHHWVSNIKMNKETNLTKIPTLKSKKKSQLVTLLNNMLEKDGRARPTAKEVLQNEFFRGPFASDEDYYPAKKSNPKKSGAEMVEPIAFSDEDYYPAKKSNPKMSGAESVEPIACSDEDYYPVNKSNPKESGAELVVRQEENSGQGSGNHRWDTGENREEGEEDMESGRSAIEIHDFEYSIESRIDQSRDDRDRVQKKTFTNWINKYLVKSPRQIDDLYIDLRDGHNLIALLEVLSGETLPREEGRMRFHRLENVQIALDFLKNRKLKLVNIRNHDITDGNPKLTLGLIWSIILHYQINDIAVEGGEDVSAKQALLLWSQRNMEGYDIQMDNFTSSWRDGKALNVIIHRNRPELVDIDKVRESDNRTSLEDAFDIAEKELGVTRLLDPEDVDVEKPDERSLLTYVSSIYDAFPEVPPLPTSITVEASFTNPSEVPSDPSFTAGPSISGPAAPPATGQPVSSQTLKAQRNETNGKVPTSQTEAGHRHAEDLAVFRNQSDKMELARIDAEEQVLFDALESPDYLEAMCNLLVYKISSQDLKEMLRSLLLVPEITIEDTENENRYDHKEMRRKLLKEMRSEQGSGLTPRTLLNKTFPYRMKNPYDDLCKAFLEHLRLKQNL